MAHLAQSHPAWDAWIEIVTLAWSRAMPASHPAWDAWIEIPLGLCLAMYRVTSHPAWDAWIEILRRIGLTSVDQRSHPAWDAWIEIGIKCIRRKIGYVASRMGCVD